jgi:competence protein ComEA
MIGMLHFNSNQIKFLALMGAVIIGLLSFLIFKDHIPYDKGDESVNLIDNIDMDDAPLLDSTLQEEQEKEEPDTIKVYIVGQVQHPGVLEVPIDCRLNEVVEMAGGFLPEADLMRVNLALKVQDEGMYIIPKIGEEYPEIEDIAKNSSVMGNQDKNQKININTADQTLLETLPRIGPTLAKNIIEYREQHGPFKKIEDIMNVPRIGEKTFQGLKDLITVN